MLPIIDLVTAVYAPNKIKQVNDGDVIHIGRKETTANRAIADRNSPTEFNQVNLRFQSSVPAGDYVVVKFPKIKGAEVLDLTNNDNIIRQAKDLPPIICIRNARPDVQVAYCFITPRD